MASDKRRHRAASSPSKFVQNVAVSSGYEQEEDLLSDAEEPSFSPALKLFVGNLPFNVDSATLAGLFERAGNVEMVEDSGNKGKDADLPENGRSNGVKKNCAHCHTTKTSKWRAGPEGPLSVCNGCGIKFEEEKEPPSINDQNKESCLVSNIGADDEYREVDDDMQFLLENDAPKVEAVVKKHSDEVFTTLGHMEQQLEELLDTVLSNCRLMTLSEKQQLRKLIQKLPPRNLDRVVEIIQCNKPSGVICFSTNL